LYNPSKARDRNPVVIEGVKMVTRQITHKRQTNREKKLRFAFKIQAIIKSHANSINDGGEGF